MDFGEEANAFIEAVVIVGRFRILITTFVSLLLWDYVTTLSAERRHIWPASVSIAKVAFLVNRAWAVLVFSPIALIFAFASISEQSCNRTYWLQSVALVVLYFPTQLILLTRVRAIWNDSRIVTAGLSIVFVAGMALSLAMAIQTGPSFVPGIDGCFYRSKQGLEDVLWLMHFFPCILELCALVLVLYKFLIYRKVGSSDLMDRLARDQVASFVVLFALNFADVMILTTATSWPYAGIMPIPTACLTSILCSRLVLNLRADGAIGNFSSSAAGVSHATSSGARRSALPANRFKWQEPTSPTRPTDVLPHHSFIALGPVSPRSRAIIISEEQVVTISSKDRDEAEV